VAVLWEKPLLAAGLIVNFSWPYEYEETLYQQRVNAFSRAQLPPGRLNFDFSRCSNLEQTTLLQLTADSTWLRRGENLLLFGPSGVGHLAAAVGRSLIDKVQSMQLCCNCYNAPRTCFNSALLKLDKYELLIVDDIGYVKKETETSVLFELIAHRYEIKSLLLTSNHPFSAWDAIFIGRLTVDRLVHHASIIESRLKVFANRLPCNAPLTMTTISQNNRRRRDNLLDI